MNILITGCFGFIGYNFLNYLIKNYNTDFSISAIDVLKSQTSVINKNKFIEKNNLNFFEIDINNIDNLNLNGIDVVLNFAAESHVDNSISDPLSFIDSNVRGTTSLLTWSLKNKVKQFIHISTDEVYGSYKESFPDETYSYNPSSPYSSSKASAELICKAYSNTYGMNINIIRPSNNYGIYQQPEKLIPFSIAKLINNEKIEIYGNGKNIRHWLHVDDTSSAILKVIESNSTNEVFNIGSGVYLENLAVVKKILHFFNADYSKVDYVDNRLGHDFRYAMNFEKIKKLGWLPKASFDHELEKIVFWYKNNQSWWEDTYSEVLKNRKFRNMIISKDKK